MSKNHIDDKIMTRLNSENVCQNSGNHLLPSHIQSKNLKTLKETHRITITPAVLFVCENLVCHSKGRIKLENVQGQSPEEETAPGG